MPTNWGWWLFSVVFLSVVLGVLANFLYDAVKDPISKWNENRRRRAREKDERKQEIFDKKVQQLLDDPYYVERNFYLSTKRKQNVNFLTISILLFMLASMILLAIGQANFQDPNLLSVPYILGSFLDATEQERSKFFPMILAIALGTSATFYMLMVLREIRSARQLYDIRKEYERRKFPETTNDEEK